MEQGIKHLVAQTDDYAIYLENAYGDLFVHCDVFRWSSKVRRQLKEEWEGILIGVEPPIFALHNSEDKKHQKFLTQMGFVPFQDAGDDKHVVYVATLGGTQHG